MRVALTQAAAGLEELERLRALVKHLEAEAGTKLAIAELERLQEGNQCSCGPASL